MAWVAESGHALFKGLAVADLVCGGGMGLAEHVAEVEEVGLRGGTLFEGCQLPAGDKFRNGEGHGSEVMIRPCRWLVLRLAGGRAGRGSPIGLNADGEAGGGGAGGAEKDGNGGEVEEGVHGVEFLLSLVLGVCRGGEGGGDAGDEEHEDEGGGGEEVEHGGVLSD